MAKPKKTEDFIEDGEIITMQDSDGDENVSLDEYMEQASGRVNEGICTIKITKNIAEINGKQKQIETVPLEKYSYAGLISYLRDEWGDGDYNFFLYEVIDGRNVRVKTTFVQIAARLKPDANSVNSALNTETNDLLKALLVSTQETKTPFEWADFLLKAAAVTTALTPIITIAIKALPKKDDPYKTALNKLEIAERVRELNGEEDESKSMMDHALTFIETAKEMIEQNKQNPSIRPDTIQSSPVQTEINNDFKMSEGIIYEEYRQFFDVLLKLAQQKLEAKTIVEKLIPNFTEDQVLLVNKLLDMDDPLSFILGYKHEFVPFCNWLIDLLNELQTTLDIGEGIDGDATLQEDLDLGDNGSKKQGNKSKNAGKSKSKTKSKSAAKSDGSSAIKEQQKGD